MQAARFGKSAASLDPGPQGRPLCFIQPCRTSHLPAGLARCLESTEIARRHLQTVSEPAASAWSGSEPIQMRKTAELSKRPHLHGPSLSGRSRPCDQIVSRRHKMGSLKLDGTVSAHHGTWSAMDSSSYQVPTTPSCRSAPFSCATVRVPLRGHPISHFTAYFPIFRPIRILKRL